MITLEPPVEEELLERLEGGRSGTLGPRAPRAQGLIEQLASLLEKAAAQGCRRCACAQVDCAHFPRAN